VLASSVAEPFAAVFGAPGAGGGRGIEASHAAEHRKTMNQLLPSRPMHSKTLWCIGSDSQPTQQGMGNDITITLLVASELNGRSEAITLHKGGQAIGCQQESQC
jgi:hypothetical protein